MSSTTHERWGTFAFSTPKCKSSKEQAGRNESHTYVHCEGQFHLLQRRCHKQRMRNFIRREGKPARNPDSWRSSPGIAADHETSASTGRHRTPAASPPTHTRHHHRPLRERASHRWSPSSLPPSFDRNSHLLLLFDFRNTTLHNLSIPVCGGINRTSTGLALRHCWRQSSPSTWRVSNAVHCIILNYLHYPSDIAVSSSLIIISPDSSANSVLILPLFHHQDVRHSLPGTSLTATTNKWDSETSHSRFLQGHQIPGTELSQHEKCFRRSIFWPRKVSSQNPSSPKRPTRSLGWAVGILHPTWRTHLKGENLPRLWRNVTKLPTDFQESTCPTWCLYCVPPICTSVADDDFNLSGASMHEQGGRHLHATCSSPIHARFSYQGAQNCHVPGLAGPIPSQKCACEFSCLL